MDITGDRVASYIAYRQDEKAAAATINRELAALKRAFRLGEKVGKVIQRPEVSMLREDNRRKGFFEADEYRAVLKHLPEELKPVIQTAYITGWRIASEILTRQKHNVNLEAGWLRLEPGETERRRTEFPSDARAPRSSRGADRKDEAHRQKTGRIIPWLFHATELRSEIFAVPGRLLARAPGFPNGSRTTSDAPPCAISNVRECRAQRLWRWSVIALNRSIGATRSLTKRC